MLAARPFQDYPNLRYQCPMTGHSLHLKAAGNLPNSLLNLTEEKIADYLVTTDCTIAYPIIDGIPFLTPEDAVSAAPFDSPIESNRSEDIAEEVILYNRIATQDLLLIDQTMENLFTKQLLSAVENTGSLGRFPSPMNLWVDSMGAADAQWEAYEHLMPLDDSIFLQLGGSGSHAIKALLAGAAIAGLVSPSPQEIRLARTMAKKLGVEDRFFGIVSIGEAIPLSSCSVNRVYGGGCLHHTDINYSIPELARISSPGGQLSFVDPRVNPLYDFWDRITGHMRFCGPEEETHDHPLDEDILKHLATKYFRQCKLYTSGGPTRYALILIKRVTGLSLSVTIAARIFRYERYLLNRLGLERLFGEMATLLRA